MIRLRPQIPLVRASAYAKAPADRSADRTGKTSWFFSLMTDDWCPLCLMTGDPPALRVLGYGGQAGD
jgi:hypothetical protein